MNRIAYLTTMTLAVLILIRYRRAGSVSKENTAGAWMLVSNDNTAPDGTKRQLFGPDPQGILILDPSGHYAQTQMRADRPKFAV